MNSMPLRLDRSLTLYFFGPLSRFFKSKGLRIPILMYHSICDETERGHPYYWINTSIARFAEQMKYLYNNGYIVISLSEAVTLISKCKSETAIRKRQAQKSNLQAVLPSDHPIAESTNHNHDKYVVLTFDDGYRDFYTEAFPLLKRHNCTGTVFLPTAFIDGQKRGLLGKEHLTWEQVLELHAKGIAFGSHTVNHPQLSGLKLDELEYELRSSRETIEKHINKSTNKSTDMDSFCYPYKFPDHDPCFVRVLRNELKGAGYRSCATTRVGTMAEDDDCFFLKRIPVNSLDDPRFLKLKLEGGYDWVGKVQYGWKSVASNKICKWFMKELFPNRSGHKADV
jgi:peptidoglycan/xylan/chitin deacetylase (PgdA/CDA1 family)